MYSHRPLDGLPESAWKGKCAPFFYASGTVSGVRQKRGVAEMKKDEVSAEKH
jgi:hypothetical protein